MLSQTRTTFRKWKTITPPSLATFGDSVGKKKTIYILRTSSFTLRCFSSAADFSCWSSVANCFSRSSTAYRNISKTVCWKTSVCGDMLRKHICNYCLATSIEKAQWETPFKPDFIQGTFTFYVLSLPADPNGSQLCSAGRTTNCLHSRTPQALWSTKAAAKEVF